MPPKIRELIKTLKDNSFVDRGDKGSHRNFLHPTGVKITISGNLGDDAKPYQEKEVKKMVKEVRENEKKG
jgi:predicted RNA binding protein YcfA (HicA-like mRNA interferase family)